MQISKITNNMNKARIADGYIVVFKHPISGKLIFLANCADIQNICYSKFPSLPGTQNIKKAKIYEHLDDARKDIYLLRYHHRDFLKIIIFAKKVLHIHIECIQTNDSQLVYYPAKDLVLLDN